MTSCTDYPFGDPPSIDETLRAIRTPGAQPAVDVLSWIAPSVAGDARFRTWWDTIGRRGASPRAAELFQHLVLAADMRDVLAGVSHPVLVLSRLDCASYDPATAGTSSSIFPTPAWPRTPAPTAPGSSATSTGCSSSSPRSRGDGRGERWVVLRPRCLDDARAA